MDNSSNDYWLVYPASHIAVFDAETQTWSLFEDHRGKTVYDTTTGNPIYISEPGPLPENTTTQAPASPIDKFENGQWVADLNTARIQKRAEINAWRDAQENGSVIFTLNGHRWDCGKASQTRLSPVVAVAKSGMLPPGFFWTDADNIDVPMTTDELTALEAAMQQNMVLQGFKIHERQRQMKEEVDKLTDYKAIKDYVVGWPE
ncbi:DUF4376 domain-containing protein [Salmonella enterica]|uniref:DUF4376 domain-containing protein n=1 Tax=Salmonella enterica subsp. houtenae serovar 45:g,z51:- TaxID=1967611 RepID=A0A701USK0_SALHO|nr:DUF4376 domain-containing protein [Salmonella enterica subsp. houtenae]EEC4492779.1 DUF4376 domain-containing protein [Salmonella enterica]HAC6518902.1 DUF4376 domain-containing protein [Salmonella enterica subsp. houtenae serovar 45:g,z51:-]HAE3152574.1 DUF4376 domain-containing protein [Salmonella enterica subsp. houtenae serovar 50:g,z51:-]HAE7575764.1 DUF4376 domain-containing protein [Salmonella enterica subsp. houtenae serovar 48:g,z51:-]